MQKNTINPIRDESVDVPAVPPRFSAILRHYARSVLLRWTSGADYSDDHSPFHLSARKGILQLPLRTLPV